jgi:hypothetical protein
MNTNVSVDSNSSSRLLENSAINVTHHPHRMFHSHQHRIRQRPVSFGNPALGTYHGCVYTSETDVSGDKDGSGSSKLRGSSRPVVEGAVDVRCIAAMVDVPPNQVPDGILNVSQSHRPFIHHVRILIADNDSERSAYTEQEHHSRSTATNDILSVRTRTDQFQQDDDNSGNIVETETAVGNLILHEQTSDERKAELVENHLQRQPTRTTSDISLAQIPKHLSFPTLTEAMENAASILANDEQQLAKAIAQTTLCDQAAEMSAPASMKLSQLLEKQSKPERTYMVLFELYTEEAACLFVDDLHDQPYTFLDDTVKCQVYHVIAIQGVAGVSLMAPLFAPVQSMAHNDDSNNNGSSSSSSSPPPPPPSSAGNNNKSVEDYNCAVCLERMDLDTSWDVHASGSSPTQSTTDGFSSSPTTSILTTVCNHSFHLDCLVQWQDSPCPVCRYDHSGLNDDALFSQCHVCSTTHNNYVCLICGIISCGGDSDHTGGSSTNAYPPDSETTGNRNTALGVPVSTTTRNLDRDGVSHCRSDDDTLETVLSPHYHQHQQILPNSHARMHYDATLHAYALCTETQHVWDFAGQGYVHRLLQNKDDGKLVEVNDPTNTTSHERSRSPGLTEAQEGEVVHRKLESFASQYYTLLKSQLEQQRIYYEGRLEEIRREYSTDTKATKSRSQTSKKRGDTAADLITALKQERQQLSQRLDSLQAKSSKVQEDVKFITSLNESLEANREPIRQQLEQAQRERAGTRKMLDECLPPLQEKVTRLMLQLESSSHHSSSVHDSTDPEVAPVDSKPAAK